MHPTKQSKKIERAGNIIPVLRREWLHAVLNGSKTIKEVEPSDLLNQFPIEQFKDINPLPTRN
jgi:hypothetical protein